MQMASNNRHGSSQLMPLVLLVLCVLPALLGPRRLISVMHLACTSAGWGLTCTTCVHVLQTL